MSVADVDVDRLLAETAGQLFARHSTPELRQSVAPGGWAGSLWSVATSAELQLLGVPEEAGGAGGTPAQWGLVVRLAGRHAAPIPLLETTVAAWLLAAAGRRVPDGPLTFAAPAIGSGGIAAADCVPYARHADAVAVLLTQDGRSSVGSVPREAIDVVPGTNLAGEPRDGIRFRAGAADDLAPVPAAIRDALRLRAALGRALQIAGALDAIEALTLAHVRDRVQFGVPLARLPVVRERLALLTEEVAMAGAVSDVAVAALDGRDAGLAVAAAKVRAGEAAGRGARLAHQLHGALGMTDEHVLHHFTRRLWAWRDEAGDERLWAVRLGRAIAGRGGAELWPTLTRLGGAAGR
jgi:acyl-CoA dehydrogenase